MTVYIIQLLLMRLIISKWLGRKHNIQSGEDKPISHYFSPFLSRGRIARSLVFCAVFMWIDDCPFVLYPLDFALSVLLRRRILITPLTSSDFS